jgi:hypothetical protein
VTQFEQAKQRARELDKLHPNFIHMVGIRYQIIRVRKYDEPNN